MRIIRDILGLFQLISSRMIGHKVHYLTVPDEVLSWIKVDRIYKFGHLIPSVVISVLLSVKVFPVLSTDYTKHLENNDNIILLAFILCLIPILIINGIIIEKVLMSTNISYKSYIKGDSMGSDNSFQE